jgi:hypothetical protein
MALDSKAMSSHARSPMMFNASRGIVFKVDFSYSGTWRYGQLKNMATVTTFQVFTDAELKVAGGVQQSSHRLRRDH